MIEIKNLSRTFHTSDGEVEALKNISLTIQDGEIFGIIGMSGAGKSTLVRCINMLEHPDEGSIVIDGVEMTNLTPAELRKERREITMIFQGFNLLMQKTCLKNICFPLELAGVAPGKAKKKALELLETVGLSDKANVYPAQLSGGQQQRVAIARALATNPKVLLCDEATSALDPNTTKSILDLIREINEKYKITVIIITHQMSVVESICNRVAILDEGVIVEQGVVGEVFANPQSQTGRQLVFPEGGDNAIIAADTDERFVRVVFNGAEATGKPIIAHMAVAKGIEANISYASTRCIENKTYGSMLLGIKGNDDTLKTAIEYLESFKDVIAKEVTIHA